MCYFPASIIQLESSPNRPASGFTLTQRRLCSPQVELHTAVPLGQHGLRALLLPDGRVIVSICCPCHHRILAPDAVSSVDTKTMVSHVWLTIRSIPFVRWLMAADSFLSWSRMAALILFSLSLSSALTDFSCSLNAAFSISPVLCCCAFDFCSKSFASVKDCS